MTYQWIVIEHIFFDLIILSLSLYILSGKLGWQKRWKAWIPGLRMYCLGDSLKMPEDGMLCGIVDLIYIIESVIKIPIPEKEYGMLTSLIHLVLFGFLFIYKLRLFIQILKTFEQGKKWIVLWIFVEWLPLLIFGIGKKYQPKTSILQEEHWKAGLKPSHTSNRICEAVPLVDEGLSIQIRERTASDFGKKRYLLKDVALNIPEKNLVLLLGGSGSGKTTMINAVIGYEKADATILLNGADVYQDYEHVKHNIGFVPQQNLIRGKDTVVRTIDDAATIRLPKNISREGKSKRISETMDLLGLSAGQQGLVSKKSGGQLRRICIATELITDPELLVLDEPDSGLDGAIAREIFIKLRQIAEEGRIVIVVTHTPDRVVDLFDKVIVLARDSSRVGRLAFYGSPQEAREFFERETMEEIVMSVNGKEEGGEGFGDEMIEKYIEKVTSGEGGEAS